MRLTLKDAFTLALLGLSTVIPSTYGATTDLNQVRGGPRVGHDAAGISSTALLHRKRCQSGSGGNGNTGPKFTPDGREIADGDNPRHPTIVNIYKLDWEVSIPPGTKTQSEIEYRVKDPKNPASVSNIRINKAEGTITLDEVNSSANSAPEITPRLFQVEMSLWVHSSGMNPDDLKAVHVESISEPLTVEVLDDSSDKRQRENMNTNTYTVNRSSHGVDLEIFNNFMNKSAFGRSAQRMTDIIDGFHKWVTAIEVSPGSGGYDDSNMAFFFSLKP